MSFHRSDVQTPENGKAIQRLSEVYRIAEKIDEYFHLMLLANDKTFSDIYGSSMSKQESIGIAEKLVDDEKDPIRSKNGFKISSEEAIIPMNILTIKPMEYKNE